MNTQEFIKYYENGHGRAVCALKSIIDKEPYRKAFIQYLKKQENFWNKDKYIINLAKILINDETKKEFIDILFNALRSGIYYQIEIFYILFEFLPREEVISFLEEEYEKAYKNCVDSIAKSDEQQSYVKYFSLVIKVNEVSGDNDDRLKTLMKDFAKIYEINKQLRPNPLTILYRKHQNNEERFAKLFAEALKDYPFYEELRSIVFASFPEPPKKEYKTVEDYLNGAQEDYHNAHDSFCNADPEIVRKVTEIAVDENAEHHLAALVLFRNDSKHIDGIEEYRYQPFPFDSKYLIDIIEKYIHLYSPEPDTPMEGCWAYAALSVLTYMKDKAAKEYCISIIKDESLHEMVRCEAIEIFNENYEPSDAEILKEFYKIYRYPVLVLLSRFANKGIKDAPYELCFDAYENAPSWERDDAVAIMAKIGLLTDEMIEECLFDECQKIREIVTEYKNRKN